jgi:hypothetical protein
MVLSVLVQDRKAAAIRSALADLATSSSEPGCMEAISEFQIAVLSRKGARPIYVATEDAFHGVVLISVDGRDTRTLKEDCALRSHTAARESLEPQPWG